MKTVVFETLWANYFDGWSIAARAYARVMEMAGIDIRLLSWLPLWEEPQPEVIQEVGHLAKRTQTWDYYIFSSPLAGPNFKSRERTMRGVLELLLSYPRPRAFYTMFERWNVQPELASILNQLDAVWVPCKANYRRMKEAGIERTIHIPIPFFYNDPLLQKKHAIGEHGKVFYWIGRWEPRKAPANIVHAFLASFRPQDKCKLIMKIGTVPWDSSTYITPEESVISSLNTLEVKDMGWNIHNVPIEFIRGKLSLMEINSLHFNGDIYVSASRGEGIDMPAFSAKLAGNKLITTDSGGTLDFIGEGDISIKNTGSIPATPYKEFWGDDAIYSDYSICDLIDGMRKAYEEPISGDRTHLLDFRSSVVLEKFKKWFI